MSMMVNVLNPSLALLTDRAALQSMVEELSQQPQPVLTALGGDESHPVVSINAPVRGPDGWGGRAP